MFGREKGAFTGATSWRSGCFEAANGGTITVDGQNITDKKININKVRENIGMVFQSYALYPHLKVIDNIAFPLRTAHVPREELEEAVADTFVALWRHAGDLDPEKSLRPWLGTVAANKARDRLRSYSPASPIPEDTPAPVDIQQQTEERETGKALWRLVDHLEEPERTLFFRYYYEGEKLKTIAADLGMNLSTAKTKLRRGRLLLREQLQGKEGVELG